MMKRKINITVVACLVIISRYSVMAIPTTLGVPTVIQPDCYNNGTISVQAAGVPPSPTGFIYKVYLNGVLLVSIDAIIANLNSLAPGVYKIIAINKADGSVDSVDNIRLDPAVNTIKGSYSILDSPRCDTSVAGGRIALSVNNARPPVTYNWFDKNNNPLPQYKDKDTAKGISVGTYYVIIHDLNGCPDTLKNIRLKEKTSMLQLVTKTIIPTSCSKNNGEITLEVTGGIHPILKSYWLDSPSYRWDTIPNPYTTTFDSLAAGLYTCVFWDTLACYPLVVNDIEIKRNLPPKVKVIGIDTVCLGINKNADSLYLKCIILDGDTSSMSYTWSSNVIPPGNTQTVYVPSDTGTYWVTVYDRELCSDSASKTVAAYPVRELQLISDKERAEVIPGETMMISLADTVGFFNIEWSPRPLFDFVSIARARLHSLVSDTVIMVSANYGPGCYSYTTMKVRLLNAYNKIIVPTFFKPGNNGQNDETFRLINGDLLSGGGDINNMRNLNVSAFEFQIFDRWGNKLFQTFDINFIWKGTDNKGNFLPNGVYPYIMKYSTFTSKFEQITKSGTILIEK